MYFLTSSLGVRTGEMNPNPTRSLVCLRNIVELNPAAIVFFGKDHSRFHKNVEVNKKMNDYLFIQSSILHKLS
jgi:hypothetical protein